VVVFGSILSALVFHFNILTIGFIPLLLVFINFVFFAFSCGIIILGLIFRYGTRIQALAWGIVPVFQPLCAAFFPLSILPKPLQYISSIFPPTFSFEAVRYSLTNNSTNWHLFTISFVENIIYCAFAIIFFKYMFKKSRDSGQFARNEA